MIICVHMAPGQTMFCKYATGYRILPQNFFKLLLQGIVSHKIDNFYRRVKKKGTLVSGYGLKLTKAALDLIATSIYIQK